MRLKSIGEDADTCLDHGSSHVEGRCHPKWGMIDTHVCGIPGREIVQITSSRRMLLVLALAIVATISYATYAFTAANTVPASTAGEGTGAISGYTISGIDYTLNGANPSNIDAVGFTLAPAPPATGTVAIKINAVGYSCTFAGAAANCVTTAPQATVAPSTTLTVIAAD